MTGHSKLIAKILLGRDVGGRAFLVLTLLAFITCAASERSNHDRMPNVLLILVDDLGWKDLGYMGSEFYETPNIDGLASEGMVFTNAYAASPVCSPSRAAIMSGKYPGRLHLTDWIPGNRHYGPHKDQQLVADPFKLQLDLDEQTLAEAMREAGYHTFFAGKWHLGEEEKYYPEHQGFDFNIGGNNTGTPRGGYFSPYNNPQLPDGPDGEYLPDRLTDETIKFIDTHRNETFFAFLSFYNVHLPMQSTDSLIRKYEMKRVENSVEVEKVLFKKDTYVQYGQNHPVYAAMVEAVDINIGRLRKALREFGLEDDTIIIFTSDNGGMATERNPNNIPTSNAPLRLGKGWLYDGGIRVPMIISWPGKAQAIGPNDTPVSGVDLYPTLLDMLDMPLKSGQHRDGTSLKPLLMNEMLGERPIFWHYPHYSGGLGGTPSGAIRLGPYKLIEFYEDMHLELYNLETDPGEQHDLAMELLEKSREMQGSLHKWREVLDVQMPHPNPDYVPQ